jgi:hypothetical protein
MQKIYLIIIFLLFITHPADLIAMDASDAPDEAEINELLNLYDKVTFNHKMHTDMLSDNCALCHHHTTGKVLEKSSCVKCHKNSSEATTVSCKDCHPKNRFEAQYLKEVSADLTKYHTDKPGLKAAYHLNCMGCHKTMGGPAGCQDCHKRNDTGDKFFYSGKYAPKHISQKSH